MNIARTALSVSMLILGSLSATGATYKFIAGSTDWRKSESYSTKLWENVPSDKLPGKDDTVYVTVPEIAIDASDAEVWAHCTKLFAPACFF